jgi:hypothetical protein
VIGHVRLERPVEIKRGEIGQPQRRPRGERLPSEAAGKIVSAEIGCLVVASARPM